MQTERRHNGIVTRLQLDRILDSSAPTPYFQATFTIENATSSPIPLTFSSSQQYDFLLQNNLGQELWKWSDGRFFAMMIMEKELGHEPWVYQERIPFVDRPGPPVPEGRYTLKARLMSRPAVESQLSFQLQAP
ncbi:MAG: BsuPI-related putative proteinase inhibitor [Acidobacteriota bacterium]